MMKLQFLGAARQVTGSQYYVEADGVRLLVDCGMYQERDLRGRNWDPSRVPAKKLDAILLTHAHVDHCGLVPKLVHEGFRGAIITTGASAELIELVLRDSAKIQAEDAAYKKRRHRKEGRRGKHPVKALYTQSDVERAARLLQSVSYEEDVPVGDGVRAVFHDAGHILGSASIELKIANGDQPRRLVFSGDIGHWGKPIVRDPTTLVEADYVVMESTYGDRDHEDHGDVADQFEEAINRTHAQGGNVVVPIFAIERAQEFIYHLAQLRQAERIPPMDVFLDSPMAADATEIFRRHRECYDVETWKMITAGDSPLRFPGLKMVRSADESKAINDHPDPAIILSTSGMCTAGRIKFHLRRNISRGESTILFVGYQARGTLGRQLVQGKPEVRIHGRSYQVKAQVQQIHGFSGHADRSELLRWLRHFNDPPRQLFLTHGEEEGALSLQSHLQQDLGWEVTVPEFGQKVSLE